MTAKDFVRTIYPDAEFVGYTQNSGVYNSSIIVSDSPCRYIGWCKEKSEEQTWEYAKKDIEYEMLRKMEK